MPLIRQLHPPPEVKFDSHEPFGVEFVVAQSKFNPLESCNPVLMLLLFTHSFSPLLCSAIREGRPSLLSPNSFNLHSSDHPSVATCDQPPTLPCLDTLIPSAPGWPAIALPIHQHSFFPPPCSAATPRRLPPLLTTTELLPLSHLRILLGKQWPPSKTNTNCSLPE